MVVHSQQGSVSTRAPGVANLGRLMKCDRRKQMLWDLDGEQVFSSLRQHTAPRAAAWPLGYFP